MTKQLRVVPPRAEYTIDSCYDCPYIAGQGNWEEGAYCTETGLHLPAFGILSCCPLKIAELPD